MRKILTRVSAVLFLVAGGAGSAACGRTAAIPKSTTPTTSPPRGGPSTVARSTGPLTAPKVSAADDAAYLKYVAEADPALGTYASNDGNAAVQVLLTDGSAFCAFLARGGGIDDAMVSLAIGAKSVEKSTHLPATVRTFNTIEASALLTLCPSEQALVPAADREKIRALGEALANTSG
jgi:hypothetical protein